MASDAVAAGLGAFSTCSALGRAIKLEILHQLAFRA